MDIAKLAIEVDASQATAATKQLQTLQGAAGKTEVATTKATGSFRMAGNGLQMMGYQVQDIAVQLGMGTSPFIVLSQQGSQVASIFGPGGAVIGALLAVSGAIAGPLVAALTAGSDKLEGFNDRVEELRNSLTSVQLKALKQDIELQEKAVASLNAEFDRLAASGVTVGSKFEQLGEKLQTEEEVLAKMRKTAKELREEMRNPIEADFKAEDYGPDASMFYDEQMRLLKEANAEQLRADDARLASRASALKAIEAIEVQQMTQQEKLTDNYLTQQSQIAAALGDGVIAVEEANALKLASDSHYYIASYQLALQDAQQRAALNATIVSSAQSLNDNLIAALEAYGQESSDLGLAAIAVQKGLMVAQAVMGANMAAIQTQVAYAGLAAATLNPALIEVGAARAELVRGMGYASAALIAATEFAPARALGGQVTAGTTYLVGERGPELVTMGANGYVTANDKLQGKSAPVINVIEDASRAGTQEVQQMGEQDIVNIFVANIQRGGAAARALQGAYGLRRAGR